MHGRLGEAMCHKYSKDNRRHKGLSIIEVAMASVLLIVAMVPILRSLTKANMLSSSIEIKTQCLVLAQGKLDEIRARSIYNFGSSGSFTASNVVLSGSYLCNVTDTTITANLLKQITVSVGYDDNGNGTLADDKIEVTLATYVARRW
jgi:Tfp pilus assembly protein PilV